MEKVEKVCGAFNNCQSKKIFSYWLVKKDKGVKTKLSLCPSCRDKFTRYLPYFQEIQSCWS